MEEIWLIMLLAGAATYAIRLSFIALEGRWQPPDWVRRALRYVPAAVLAAIIFQELLLVDGVVAPGNPRLFAGLLAAAVAWRTRNGLLTVAVGMISLWVLQGLGAAGF